jgi:hypothetical protein
MVTQPLPTHLLLSKTQGASINLEVIVLLPQASELYKKISIEVKKKK